MYDGAPKNIVAGFAVCTKTFDKRYYDDGETSEWWYVEWIALLEKYQGIQPSGATLLWNKIVEVATEKGLPIMLNTLKTNKRMQQWCERRGLTPEGSKSATSILTFYSYQKHLPENKRVDLAPYRSGQLTQPILPSQSSATTTPNKISTQQSQPWYTRVGQNFSQFWASPKNYLQSWYNRYKTPIIGGTTVLVGSGFAAWLMRYKNTSALQPRPATPLFK